MKQPCCFNETRLLITQSEPMDDVFNAGWAFLKATVPLKKQNSVWSLAIPSFAPPFEKASFHWVS